ncbi:MAG: TetR/AcrR family transcriptional regulator [Faecalibacillus sp.]
MNNTKEKILMTALHLFARDGYEAVSVSDIAKQLDITKGALYKHYQNKQDIFDSIVKRMYEIDEQRSLQYHVPELKYEDDPSIYKEVSLDHLKNFTLAQFSFWLDDEFASAFRKMLVLEQYRNQEIAKLYNACLVEGPIDYTKDIFQEMIKNGVLLPNDANQLALEFYAPFYLFLNMSDLTYQKEKYRKMFDNHLNYFIQKYRK